ncbi:MAG: cellulose biosynthesis cyclic di-GMP-binding regulatory protein BcsB [Chloroflexota bacterium]
MRKQILVFLFAAALLTGLLFPALQPAAQAAAAAPLAQQSTPAPTPTPQGGSPSQPDPAVLPTADPALVTQAAAPTSVPQPTPAATPAAPVVLPAVDEQNIITFTQLRRQEIVLNGPYDSYSFVFGVPADWKLGSGAVLDLSMSASFNALTGGLLDGRQVFGGTLLVSLNGRLIGTLVLTQNGEIYQQLPIPDAALSSRRSDGRMEIGFTLDSGVTCTLDQQMTLFIHPLSRFVLPHESVLPSTSLLQFPRPLFQSSIYPDTALVVVPGQPSAAELQSAMTVAAGLSSQTSSAITLTLTTAEQVTPEQLAGSHLVLVGKAAGLPLLSELALPLAPAGGQFQVAGVGPDDGIVQMVNSPWNPAYVVLLVSGSSDSGVTKAAQAVSGGVLRPFTSENLAIIDQVQTDLAPTALQVDQTLGDLGYTLETLQRVGVNTASYEFYLPPGQQVSEGASFELFFGNSALLNYDRSGLVVLLNGQPIGSVRFTDETSRQALNQVKITIPPSAALPGNNQLDVEATLVLRDNCVNPNQNGVWATVWPESRLHLPLSPSAAGPMTGLSLNVFPAPYVLHPTLGSTAFVLPKDQPQIWNAALRLAGFLGDRANAQLVTLAVFYGDQVDQAVLQRYHLLVVGQPSQMPLVDALNESLPAPFEGESDIASEQNLQVRFRIPPDSPIGYVQMLASPWNQDHVVVAALGNQAQGVIWAASALVEPNLRSKLAGNFAVINDQQVITTDTRLTLLTPGSAVVSGSGGDAPAPSAQAVDLSPAPEYRPAWIMPAMLVSAALIVLILLVAIIGGLARSRGRR